MKKRIVFGGFDRGVPITRTPLFRGKPAHREETFLVELFSHRPTNPRRKSGRELHWVEIRYAVDLPPDALHFRQATDRSNRGTSRRKARQFAWRYIRSYLADASWRNPR